MAAAMEPECFIENGSAIPRKCMGRLHGGAGPNQNADELIDVLEESDRETKPTTSPARIKFIEEKEPQPAPVVKRRPKPTTILKYGKMIILSLIMVIAIILLARVKEHRHLNRYMTVSPSEEKCFMIPQSNEIKQQVSITVNGPFTPDDNSKESGNTLNENTEPVLKIHLLCNAKADKETITPWVVAVSDPNNLDSVIKHTHQHDFSLKSSSNRDNVSIVLYTKNVGADLGVLLTIDKSPIDKNAGILYGACVLIFLYIMIVTEIINRTLASLIASSLSLGILAMFDSRPVADIIISWIDVETLALLVGMMILVSVLAESGIFDYFAVFAYKVAKGRVWPLINCLCFFTASLAAFLDSVTMMLLVTPVTIRLCEVLGLNPVPVLICMVVFANVGAAMTPVGDPPNVIISLNPIISKSNVNFGNFVLHMFPGVILGLIQCYIHVRLLFRKPSSLRFKEPDELQQLRHEIAVWERTAAGISPYSQDEDVARETLEEKIEGLKMRLAEAEAKALAKNEQPSFEVTLAQLTKSYPIRDKPLLVKATLAFAFVLVLFFGHSVPGMSHISLGWSALIGAFLLIIIADKRDLEAILVKIEWSTLLFFAALFVVMESLSELGLIDIIGELVVEMIMKVDRNYQLMLSIIIVIWVSAIASAFLDNIPVTTMMVKIIITLSQDKLLRLPLHPLVWALAFGACFGGNGTLIGASANVVTAGVAEQHGYRISFIKFFIVCFPIMIGSIVVSMVYLLVAHVVFTWHDP